MSENNIQTARQIYSIDHWSAGYFDINHEGLLDVGLGSMARRVPLRDILDEARRQGLRTPLLVRIGGILKDRVRQLCAAFDQAMTELDFAGNFTSVYPIKVNQQRHVVETLCSTRVASPRCAVGLEAGSKPELMAVLAFSKRDSVIVCNGYKDREFIRLALIGEKMGRQVFIVVEKLSELRMILQESAALGVAPRIGLRARLSSIGKGNWQNTGGEKSKFGLSAAQIIEVLDVLRESGQLDCLQLLHFHLGSQISNIRDIQGGMKEASRYFAELRHAGAAVDYVDVGGGLGVDYEGTRSRSFCSINYSMNEYAYAIVAAVKEVCQREGLEHPNIITESGRAMTAHHAFLVADIIGREARLGAQVPRLADDAPSVLTELAANFAQIHDGERHKSLTEIYHEVAYRLGEAHEMFTHGLLTLEQKSQAEQFYSAASQAMLSRLDATMRVHQEIRDELHEKLADKVFLNFSLFQSIPDVWGIDQVFPIMPIEKLDQPMARRGVLQDITCDSDGRVDKYVDSGGLSTSLPLPEYGEDEGFRLAIFMVGAYQEILGDMHNLFGDTDSVDVHLHKDGSFTLKHAMKGSRVDEILEYVNYEPRLLLQRIHEQLVGCGLPVDEHNAYLAELKDGLTGYTYLE